DLPQIKDSKKLVLSINAVLPKDIAIYNFQDVPDSFHARYSATERCYKFYITEMKKPLWNNRAYHITFPVNWNLVTLNIPYLIGTHDFTSFCSSKNSTQSKVCTVKSAKLEKKNGTIYIFTIWANRFVYKMVRSIMGTLIDIGRGKISESLNTVIQSKNRELVGQTAPPHGLVLDYVTYSEVL
ncbi:MAG: tRNA pseudouridine(38-40) synthase TruA, partial [Chitinispirillia bacterium]